MNKLMVDMNKRNDSYDSINYKIKNNELACSPTQFRKGSNEIINLAFSTKPQLPIKKAIQNKF